MDYIRARGAWSAIAEEQAEADRRSDELVETAVRHMLDLSPEDFAEALDRLGKERCLDCGSREADPEAHWCPAYSPEGRR